MLVTGVLRVTVFTIGDLLACRIRLPAILYCNHMQAFSSATSSTTSSRGVVELGEVLVVPLGQQVAEDGPRGDPSRSTGSGGRVQVQPSGGQSHSPAGSVRARPKWMQAVQTVSQGGIRPPSLVRQATSFNFEQLAVRLPKQAKLGLCIQFGPCAFAILWLLIWMGLDASDQNLYHIKGFLREPIATVDLAQVCGRLDPPTDLLADASRGLHERDCF